MSIGYVKVKREKVSQCNICRREELLSYDHVPPKGGIDLSIVEQETILERVTVEQGKRKYSISQNGVKFRTICRKCNSILGEKYDTVLNDFAIGVGKFLKSTIDLPPIVHYETRPTALIRALLGHLLATKAHIDDVSFD